MLSKTPACGAPDSVNEPGGLARACGGVRVVAGVKLRTAWKLRVAGCGASRNTGGGGGGAGLGGRGGAESGAGSGGGLRGGWVGATRRPAGDALLVVLDRDRAVHGRQTNRF